jgi:hypothetical protein
MYKYIRKRVLTASVEIRSSEGLRGKLRTIDRGGGRGESERGGEQRVQYNS